MLRLAGKSRSPNIPSALNQVPVIEACGPKAEKLTAVVASFRSGLHHDSHRNSARSCEASLRQHERMPCGNVFHSLMTIPNN